ncbi:unnamed protein product [Rotaria sordida]|uniref:Uncharacterized protein n=1 Tax=Rotaria sordida TaxID=392033 RepID=A0A814PXQ9_9BILA|nr:unnamed protein product [Rotaria sordida]CAF3805852.1 unnamed protein product [Rotaria sordida]
MGLVSSTCKHKKRGKMITIIHDKYTQTTNTLPSIINGSSYHHDHYLSSHHHVQKYPISPSYSIVFDKFSIPSHRSNSYEPKTFDRISIRTDPPRRSLVSNIIHNTSDHEHRTLIRVQSSLTINENEQSYQKNLTNESHLVKHSASNPIDTFLIDISNEKVRMGQPVTMNIRHLLLNTPKDIHTKSLTSVCTKISPKTTYVHENFLNYIPNVCERYPNLTVDPNQSTRSTLHAHLPLQFFHEST